MRRLNANANFLFGLWRAIGAGQRKVEGVCNDWFVTSGL